MTTPKVVFAIEDWTTLSVAKPLATVMENEFNIEFLLLDGFRRTDNDRREVKLQRESINYPYYNFEDYLRINTPAFGKFTHNLPQTLLRRLIADNISHEIPYKIEKFLQTSTPDVFICCVDSIPFVRHIIQRCYNQGILTVVLQHGTYADDLDPEKIEDKSNWLTPKFDSNHPILERLKRRLGYRYGITTYTHPHVDIVMTMGEFFTGRISELRKEYPCRNGAEVVTTGTPEYDSEVKPFDAKTSSALFLSQQQYETGKWDRGDQDKLIRILTKIDDQIPVTVRPHPTDSGEKKEMFKSRFPVSNRDDLDSDIARHDVILTIHSTAIFSGIIQGKVCCSIQPPWNPVTFPPFTHSHVIQIETGDEDIGYQMEDQSVISQQDYLEEFCYMPNEDINSEYSSSAELITSKTLDRLNGS